MNLRPARNTRIWYSRWLIASLLFLQMASAAYACAMPSAAVDAASMAGQPCAQFMADGTLPALDPEQPGLCLEHCKGGSQTVDQQATASLAVPALVALFMVTAAAEQPAQASAWQAQRRSRDRTPPTAHSILHCCYRI
ncbi:MAG: hypothetical protein H0W40_10375 [Methylibium sp.]|uniref:hypothetical protein n=1 Tax=Methylibium sp. TaxID=2067992 RepID=UPI0017F80CCD|nr:hypothetical protein [Methylibium sp.]MBA3597766.1 hypothetical protein [Methylibium sp.]